MLAPQALLLAIVMIPTHSVATPSGPSSSSLFDLTRGLKSFGGLNSAHGDSASIDCLLATRVFAPPPGTTTAISLCSLLEVAGSSSK